MALPSCVQNQRIGSVRQCHVFEEDVTLAIDSIFEQTQPTQRDTLVLFVSSLYPLQELMQTAHQKLSCNIYGCTTSGEIGAGGYRDHSISGALFSDDHFEFIPNLHKFYHEELRSSTDQFSDKFDSKFTIALLEGLSGMEERAVADYCSRNHFPLVGGSSGDDLGFKETYIFVNGHIYQNAGLFLSCSTDYRIEIFKAQHFEPTNVRLVTTRTDPSRRIVFEINGKPAALEYARLVGCAVEDLGPDVFAIKPILLKIGSEYFIRSIQKVNEDLSLTFYCAIADGMVLRFADGHDIVESVKTLKRDLVREQNPSTTLIFECILRKLELERLDLKDQSFQAMEGLEPVGFHTYGEQMNSIHINQTISGIAFYSNEEKGRCSSPRSI